MPQAMLRLFATPVMSAFLPSSNPISHLRVSGHHRLRRRSRPRTGCTHRAAKSDVLGAPQVEQHVLGIDRVRLAIIPQVPEARLLVGAYRGHVRACWSDDAIRDAIALERRGQEFTDERRAVALADEVGLADEDVDRYRRLVDLADLLDVLWVVLHPVRLPHAHGPPRQSDGGHVGGIY